jgi:uncharacterized protein YecT (DUF1311 family)
MKNLLKNKLLYFYLVQLLIIIIIPVSTLGKNKDNWDESFKIQQKCLNTEHNSVPAGQICINICMSKELEKSDVEMNSLYKKLMSLLVEEKMLRDSQRSWLKFRDFECKLRTSGMGEGSATPFVMDSCILDLTLKRIKDLEHLEKNGESGCGGCPVFKLK